jgi:neutral ceramidase
MRNQRACWLVWLIGGVAVAVSVAPVAAAADDTAPFTMKAGVAKVAITPDAASLKELTTVMGTKATTIDHDIYARALVLNDGTSRLAIVTYDLNCLDVATPILRVRCRDELQIPPSHLILMATHNHAAPIQICPENFAYGRGLADRIFDLIKVAINNEQGPVRVSLGQGYDYHIRAVGNAPADYDVHLLKVTADDKVLAVLFNHPTHPLQSSRTHIDTGHPGYAVEFVEAAFPGSIALYADACGGNQFPDRGTIMYSSADDVKAMGRDLGESGVAIAQGETLDVTGKIASTLEVLSLPLAEPMPYEQAQELAREKKVPLDIGFVPYPHPDRGTNWIRALLQHHEQNIPFPKRTTDRVCTDDEFLVEKLDDNREFPCRFEEVIVTTIGPLCFVAMQGEVCAPIGMRIKDAFRRQMPLFLGSYAAEHNLYIPTRELVRLDAYQAQVIKIQYASPVGWAPEVEDEMVEGVCKVVTKMTGKNPEKVVR